LGAGQPDDGERGKDEGAAEQPGDGNGDIVGHPESTCDPIHAPTLRAAFDLEQPPNRTRGE
jgi:hypothetical protein